METRLCVIEPGASGRLGELLRELGVSGRRCAIYDAHTYEAKGLCRPRAEREIVLPPEGLHANEDSTAEVLRRLPPDTELLIAVGGGTVHDITRYCAKHRGLPFVSVPTAASCDGFCSTVAAMTWEGCKNTMQCVAPVLVAADTDVFRQAPAYLTASGVGDMLGKYTALADWRIARVLTGEPLCRRIYDIMASAVKRVWDSAPDAADGSREAFEAVMAGLLMSGLAMQMLGTSRPASGGEHHISHLIETEPEALHVHSDALHGEKVGVGTILASAEYHRLAAVEDIAPRVEPYRPIDQEELRAFFGEALYPVIRRENENDCLAAVTPGAVIKAWPEIREIVSGIPAAEEVSALLEKLGAKRTLADIGVPEGDRAVLLDASPLIRNRLTLMRVRRMLRA